MRGSKHVFKNAQRGVTLSGLIVVLAMCGVIGIFALKILPTFIEYRAVKNGIAAAKAAGGTVREMQQSFDKNADINDIEAISGRDLMFSKDSGQTEIAFSYEKRVPIAGNATLLLQYSGTTDKSGVVPEKTVAAQ